MRFRGIATVATAGLCVTLAAAVPAGASGKHHKHARSHPRPVTSSARFSVGQLQATTPGRPGCGQNQAAEPSIHVSKSNLVALGSENGLGNGSEFWSAHQVGGTRNASACRPTYDGQPNAFGHLGLSGGDVDVAIAPVKDTTSNTYRIYVASLNLASVNVATSTDDGKSFNQVPVVEGLPLDDREWIAAYGAQTALLTYHDIVTDNIDVLRSDDGGNSFFEESRAIPDGDYRASNNQHGNIVIDHRNTVGAASGQFWAYQSFVAPSNANNADQSIYDGAFLAVSNDGGSTWTDKAIPCLTPAGKKNGLAHNFPNVSVAPNGTLFYSVSNDKAIYVAMSSDHGDHWTCSGAISTGSQAIFPWIVATSAGEDLVYYASKGTGDNQIWYAEFAQNLTQSVTGWRTTQVTAVHKGQVCEGGISCNGNRQLFDDFGVDTDMLGWAHIAYSHDSPTLGGQNAYTGYAVQTGGRPVGYPN